MLDLNKDKTGGLAKTHKNALKVVEDLSERLELSDAWSISSYCVIVWVRVVLKRTVLGD